MWNTEVVEAWSSLIFRQFQYPTIKIQIFLQQRIKFIVPFELNPLNCVRLNSICFSSLLFAKCATYEHILHWNKFSNITVSADFALFCIESQSHWLFHHSPNGMAKPKQKCLALFCIYGANQEITYSLNHFWLHWNECKVIVDLILSLFLSLFYTIWPSTTIRLEMSFRWNTKKKLPFTTK